MEIFIAALLIIVAGYILFKNIKKSSKGDCNCGSCSSHCSKYKK
ncbi:MAG: FeoB-associated Cys-rich membrane protein [Clostridium sp.]|uniref:FeoB-associated Cys-rich membrane protein n=1 Tax=Clostridium saudiense TaxID=1414720 RepID=A0ABS2FID9_9CLOT|nr:MULTISPECIES: FeoB-associated Cys-rich membrane protein [Clostridiaceae]MBM6820096.1 FeoB-associated Cys-rich membrane protein [Clostridium saudiense]MBQ8998929.1 FeoB-associated Cys-rich membrane protein [Clostridium sp.]